MKRIIVVHGRARVPIPRKIEKDRYVVTSMTGNAHFTTPNPTLASVTAAINALETAYITAQGGWCGRNGHHARQGSPARPVDETAGLLRGDDCQQ